jgi:hypothetical protein
MTVKSFFRSILRFFQKADKALIQIEDILPDALFIVDLVAKATPGRTDDELVGLAKDFGFGPVQLSEYGRKEDLLRAIARTALQKRVRLSIKESVLNAAIELAVLEHKP